MNQVSVQTLLECATLVVREAAALIEEKGSDAKVYGKIVDGDLKISLDRKLDDFITKSLAVFNIPVLSEEGAIRRLDENDVMWVVDPLDGTLNYSRKLGPYCVSIALIEKKIPVFGVIWNSSDSKVSWGGRGLGAWQEGNQLLVSKRTDMGEFVLATGMSNTLEMLSNNQIDVMQSCWRVRMLGSAAYSLLAVARGAIDIYYEEQIQIWDVAAGLAIVEGAGGTFTLNYVGNTTCCNVFAANHQELGVSSALF